MAGSAGAKGKATTVLAATVLVGINLHLSGKYSAADGYGAASGKAIRQVKPAGA